MSISLVGRLLNDYLFILVDSVQQGEDVPIRSRSCVLGRELTSVELDT